MRLVNYMRLGIVLLCTFLASILLLSNILPSYAGDPVPGIDVSLEQIPGGTKNFGPSDSGIVTVSIPKFGDPDIMDTIEVSLRSNTDKSGLLLKILETAPNSGIFKTGFSLTDSGRSSGTTLRVTQGDTITAEFMGVSTNGSIGGDVDTKSNASNAGTDPSQIAVKEEGVKSAAKAGKEQSEADAAKTVKEKDDRITAKNAKECKAEGGTWVVNSQGKGFCYMTLGKAKDAGVKEEGVKSVNKKSNAGKDPSNDVAQAASSSKGYISGKGGDGVVNVDSTQIVITKTIISKLKDALSQSNNPEALKLLSELEEVWNQPAKAKAGKEQSKADAAKKEATLGHKSVEEKKGLNAVNVKLAIAKLKDDLKSNPKALKLLKGLENEISKAAKVIREVAIDETGLNKAISKLKDELSKSNPEALKSLKALEDEIAQEVENHNSSRSNKGTS